MQKYLLLLTLLASSIVASDMPPLPPQPQLDTPYAPTTPVSEPSEPSQHYTQEELDAILSEQLGGRSATWGRNSQWTKIALERAKAEHNRAVEQENPDAPTVGEDNDTSMAQQLKQLSDEFEAMDLEAFPHTPRRSLEVEISKSTQSLAAQKESGANEHRDPVSFSGLNLPTSMFNQSSKRYPRIDSENEAKREFADEEIEHSSDREDGDDSDGDIAASINTQPELQVPDVTPELNPDTQWQMPPSLDTSKNPTPAASVHGESDSDDGVSDYQAAIKAAFGSAQQSANAASAARASDLDDVDDAGSPSNFQAAIASVTGAKKDNETIAERVKKQFNTERGRKRAEERAKNRKATPDEPDYANLDGLFSRPEEDKKTDSGSTPTSTGRKLLYTVLAASGSGACWVAADWMGYDVGIDFTEMYIGVKNKLKRLFKPER